YLPLDPEAPPERQALMLNDGRVAILLTQQSLIEGLPAEPSERLCLDRDWELLANESQDDPPVRSRAANLAYVIYTSGSTGRPKGVAVSHRGVVRLLCGVDYMRLGSDQRLLQLAPLCFDASTFELWGALLHGGECVLMPEGVASFAQIGDAVKARG